MAFLSLKSLFRAATYKNIFKPSTPKIVTTTTAAVVAGTTTTSPVIVAASSLSRASDERPRMRGFVYVGAQQLISTEVQSSDRSEPSGSTGELGLPIAQTKTPVPENEVHDTVSAPVLQDQSNAASWLPAIVPLEAFTLLEEDCPEAHVVAVTLAPKEPSVGVTEVAPPPSTPPSSDEIKLDVPSEKVSDDHSTNLLEVVASFMSSLESSTLPDYDADRLSVETGSIKLRAVEDEHLPSLLSEDLSPLEGPASPYAPPFEKYALVSHVSVTFDPDLPSLDELTPTTSDSGHSPAAAIDEMMGRIFRKRSLDSVEEEDEGEDDEDEEEWRRLNADREAVQDRESEDEAEPEEPLTIISEEIVEKDLVGPSAIEETLASPASSLLASHLPGEIQDAAILEVTHGAAVCYDPRDATHDNAVESHVVYTPGVVDGEQLPLVLFEVADPELADVHSTLEYASLESDGDVPSSASDLAGSPRLSTILPTLLPWLPDEAETSSDSPPSALLSCDPYPIPQFEVEAEAEVVPSLPPPVKPLVLRSSAPAFVPRKSKLQQSTLSTDLVDGMEDDIGAQNPATFTLRPTAPAFVPSFTNPRSPVERVESPAPVQTTEPVDYFTNPYHSSSPPPPPASNEPMWAPSPVFDESWIQTPSVLWTPTPDANWTSPAYNNYPSSWAQTPNVAWAPASWMQASTPPSMSPHLIPIPVTPYATPYATHGYSSPSPIPRYSSPSPAPQYSSPSPIYSYSAPSPIPSHAYATPDRYASPSPPPSAYGTPNYYYTPPSTPPSTHAQPTATAPRGLPPRFTNPQRSHSPLAQIRDWSHGGAPSLPYTPPATPEPAWNGY